MGKHRLKSVDPKKQSNLQHSEGTIGQDVKPAEILSRFGGNIVRPSDVRSLQRIFGNRVVTGLIQRDVTEGILGVDSPKPKDVPLKLTDSQKTLLIGEVGDRIGIAFSKFSEACNDKAAALRAAAKDSADFASLLIGIGLSFVMPGLGKGLAAGISKLVPVDAPDLAYKAAIKGIDNADKIVGKVIGMAKDATVKEVERVLRRTEAENFLEEMKQAMSVTAQKVRMDLINRADTIAPEEIYGLLANYDAGIATKEAYLKKISSLVDSYQKEVAPIGDVDITWLGQGGSISHKKMAYWIEGPAKTYLAILKKSEHSMASLSGAKPRYEFVNWVYPKMMDMAIAKTEAMNKKVETIPLTKVTGIKMKDVLKLSGFSK